MGKLLLQLPEELHDKIREECLKRSTPKKRYSQQQYILDCLDLFVYGVKYDCRPKSEQSEKPTSERMLGDKFGERSESEENLKTGF